MAPAFGWGLLAASSLVIGAVFALVHRVRVRTVGLVLGFGAGALISAVARGVRERRQTRRRRHDARPRDRLLIHTLD